MKNILIAVPSPIFGWSHLTTYMVDLTVYSASQFHLGYRNLQGALLPVLRDNLVLYAIQNGGDYILFIDSDMKFPRDGLEKLFNHQKDVIGVNAAIKDSEKAALGIELEPVLKEDIHGTPLDQIKTSIVEMSGVGMAFTLINLKVFDGMKQPYFYIDYGYDDQGGFHHWGEDKSFCRDIIEKGFGVWCDLELSKQIMHIGEFDYRLK